MTRYELSKDQVRHCTVRCRDLLVLPTTIKVLEQKQAFDLLDIDGNGKVTYQEVKELELS